MRFLLFNWSLRVPPKQRTCGTGGRVINLPLRESELSKDVCQPRAQGALIVSARADSGQSTLAALRQEGSYRALFPRAGPECLQTVVINTAGGVTGGDKFSVRAKAEVGATLTLTTQAAERAYRALPGEVTRVANHLTIEDEARLNWLPQETILFNGCALERSLDVEIAGAGRFLMVEPLIFGRALMGETLQSGQFHDRVSVRRDRPNIYLDQMTFAGDIAAHLARPTVANGAGAMATLLFVAPEAEAMLALVRDLLPDTAGASLLHDDMLVLRALATDSHQLRKFLVPILNLLTGDALPRPWMI